MTHRPFAGRRPPDLGSERARTAYAAALTASGHAAEPLPSEVAGPEMVGDGDTLTVGPSEVRLFGIDAPEMRSGHGHFVRAELEDLIAGQKVHR
jgi:endonuclease YncB( thermonuclease family)